MNNEMLTRIVQSGAGILISILIGFIAWQTNKWTNSIDEVSKSVSELNTKLEVVMTQFSTSSEYTHRTLSDHELRLRSLEGKRK